jgi:hypothetical protein
VREALAERLLAKVMNWFPEDVARERPILQALALLKYDEYQQFSPGMRFVESLAFWLDQFTEDDRKIAYKFVCERLIFFSEAEMAHFAAIMYPDFIRPMLFDWSASGKSPYRVRQIAQSVEFQTLQTSTLFLGLSDGARIDQFRRSNRELSHEQILTSYEIPEERVLELRDWLLKQNSESCPVPAIVLLDDFAGSGTSYVRNEAGVLKGKLPKFLRRVTSSKAWQDIAKFPETKVIVALYVATEQALENIQEGALQLETEFGAKIEICPVQSLDSNSRITSSLEEPFIGLIEKHYDPLVEDEHTKKGGTNLKYGFAACGLPLVLHHNTPNNSLFLLWVEESTVIRPLFPRFSRHRREL